MTTHQRFTPLAAAIIASTFALGSAAHADLVHRYSFNDGTAADSVGGADGVLNGNASVSNGVLNTRDDGAGSFLSLPDTVGSGIQGSFSIEQFVTVNNSDPRFDTLFAIANDVEPNGLDWILANPQRPQNGDNNLVTTFNSAATNNAEAFLFAPPGVSAPVGTEFLYTLTYDVSDNGGTFRLYSDAVELASLELPGFDFSAVSGNRNTIGGPLFNDPVFDGQTNEFRIWDEALSPAQIATNLSNGPDVVPEPTTAGLLLVAGGGVLMRRRRIG